MPSNDASTRAPITRFTLGMLALSLLTLGCDPVEPMSDDDLLAEDDEEELDALAAMPEDEEDDEVEDDELGQGDAADEPWPAPADGDASFDLTAENDPMGSNWTYQWFSEETGGSQCPVGHLVTGVTCDGWYCDNKMLQCNGPYNVGASAWTGWFSEEGTNYQICPGSSFVSGMYCSGYWCDSLALRCTNTSAPWVPNTCAWSGWYSEENPWGLGNAFTVPAGHAIKGVQCSGPWCDNLRYYYCPI